MSEDPTTLTIEAILREISHLRDLLDTRADSFDSNLQAHKHSHDATHKDVVDVAIKHTHDLFTARLNDADSRYEQRYVAQTQALDAALKAQQLATQSALASADKAVTSALTSADKAVAKAETLNERRFDLINETTAMTHTLMDRLEQLSAKVDGLDRLTEAKFVTIRTLIESQADKVALALTASDKAVSKAEGANEKRFEGVNEFRGQLADQAQTLMPRTEAVALNSSLSARIDASLVGLDSSLTDLKSRLDRAEGKSGGYSAGAGALIAGIGVIATLITIVTGIILVVN